MPSARDVVAMWVMLCTIPGAGAGMVLHPTYVHGLAYPHYDQDIAVETRTKQDRMWVAATFTCKNPKHVMALSGYAKHIDPVLTEKVWGKGEDLEREDMDRYIITRRMAAGAEATVYEAVDRNTGKLVAIKKVTHIFDKLSTAYKVWAEVKMLNLASDSPDIMKLSRLILGLNTAYIVLEMLEVQVPSGQRMVSGDILTKKAATTLQRRVHQYIRGVAFMHSANLVHNDLRWHNVMLDEDCNVVIIDLGNISPARPVDNNPILTTLPMQHDAHQFRRDIWQAGATILSWIAGGDVYHLTSSLSLPKKAEGIVKVFGYPSAEILAKYSEEVQSAFEDARPLAGLALNLTAIAPEVDRRAFDLISEMMRLDRNVPSAVELLQHPYLSDLSAKEPLPEGPGKMSGAFEFAMLAIHGSADDARHLLHEEAAAGAV